MGGGKDLRANGLMAPVSRLDGEFGPIRRREPAESLASVLPAAHLHALEARNFPSDAMRVIREAISRVALSDVPVLLQGESGVGKEVLARQLHMQSQRSEMPFVKLNCAALPSELLESELFGYERGAFTGAFRTTPGQFEQASGGTLLLDEIGDMDIRLQAKILHVLQDREYRRLGGSQTVHVDVRLVAATHWDLKEAVAGGRFREDLYYRLNVICLRVPPLRERRSEIPGLVRCFLKKHSAPGIAEPVLTQRLLDALTSYDWPGNIRELENVVQRLLVLRDQETLISELALPDRQNGAGKIQFRMSRSADRGESFFQQAEHAKCGAEAQAILDALAATRGNRKQAAELLGVKYKALLYRIKKLQLRPIAP